MDNFQPGQVISPNSATPPPPSPDDGAPTPVRQPETTEPVSSPSPSPETTVPTATQASTEPAFYTPPVPIQPSYTAPISNAVPQSIADPTFDQTQQQDDSLEWVASEFHDHDKGIGWFALLALVGVVTAAIIYLLTKDKITTGIIVITAIYFGVFAARKPREQRYVLNYEGLQVGVKFYPFHDFKSFSTVEESTATSVVFMPLKRFMPPLTIYVPQDMEESVIDFLAQVLPVEQHKADALDSLLRRIHF